MRTITCKHFIAQQREGIAVVLTEQIVIRLTEADLQALRAIATAEGRPVSNAARHLIKTGLAERERQKVIEA